MLKFYYTQTVVYSLVVEATTAEEADAIAHTTDINDARVVTTNSEWEEDGYEDA